MNLNIYLNCSVHIFILHIVFKGHKNNTNLEFEAYMGSYPDMNILKGLEIFAMISIKKNFI